MSPTALRQAVPCSDCGTRDGHVYWGNHRPARIHGRRFGIDGPLCVACYYKHRYRKALAADLVDAIEAAERRRQYLKHFDGEDHHDQHPGRGQNVLVRCRFFRSAFPPERIFVIRARDGAARQQERRSTDGG
jgi:hypothetical protein